MTEAKLNILFLPKWYPSKFSEFDGNFIENHAIAVSKKCNLGLIFAHSDEKVEKTFKLERTDKHGFPEFRVFYQRPKYGLKILNQAISLIRYRKAQTIGYKAYLNEIGKPDVCHVHVNGRSTLLANFLKETQKIPFVISEHWSGYTKESAAFQGYFRKKYYQYAAKSSNRITCVSEYLQKAVQSHNIEGNFSIIPNVVDTELFQLKEHSNNQKTRIIHISNLTKTPKNIHLIVEALHQVGLKRNDFEVDFIGTGPDEDFMLEHLKKGSLADRFHFHGEIELPQVAEILAKADFLLLYSQFETQSVVMLEAFACGVPVLSSNAGAISEHLNDKRGLLLAPNSTEVLAKGIEEMLGKYKSCDSSELRKYAIDKFSVASIQQQFLELYHQILKNG